MGEQLQADAGSGGGTVYVVGAGGIGCAVGHALLAAGRRVVFVEADARKVAFARGNGVVVNGRAVAAEVVPFADWQPPAGGWVLLCTKCYDNAAVLARLPAGVNLVPVQNGFDPALAAFGHALEGIASFVAACEPGTTRVTITRPGELHLGPRGNEPPDRGYATLGHFLSAGGFDGGPFRVCLVRAVEPYKFTKLMYNAAISPLAAAAGLDNGALLSDPDARRLFFALLQENYAVLADAGVEFGKVGPFHPRTVARILRRKWLARLLARAFEPSLRGTYCSMAGEIQTGRTEIDNYTGHLLRLAEGRHAAPLNRAVYDTVTRMMRERAEPRREVLRELAAAL